jgi:tRNA synthetases class I (R)/Arginyl tRNA synthetase N terminal domain
MKHPADCLHSVPFCMVAFIGIVFRAHRARGLGLVCHRTSSVGVAFRYATASTSFGQTLPSGVVGGTDLRRRGLHSRASTVPTVEKSACFLRMSSTTSTTPSTTSGPVAIKSIEFVQDAVLEALIELFDPAEVARGAALARLENPTSKKKKKKKPASEVSDVTEEESLEQPELSVEEKRAIADAAAADAKPFAVADTMVTLATKAEFGDYQVNAAMGLAKSVGMNPRECAAKLVERITPKIRDFMEEPEIAGPGFINLRFKRDYLTAAVRSMALDADGRLGLPRVSKKRKIVVDYSSPNIAKEMHVGHLRSTIIGDSISNLLAFQGHEVVRLNHVGDWGTQFGMLVEHLREEYPAALSLDTSQDVDLGDLVELYKAAKKRFDVDDDFKTRAREGVVKLQAGNQEEVAAWQALCAASRVEYQKIYDLLNIKGLEERGESFYNPYLHDVVADLENQGLAVESEGAIAIFLQGVSIVGCRSAAMTVDVSGTKCFSCHGCLLTKHK